jgi:hypothetical protein
LIESLESRQLLSGTVPLSQIQGYTPAQIAHAYNFDKISMPNGAALGAGQTIAIIDAYNDPNISADVSVFDQEFGLAAASLKVVNENGGATLPITDPGWAGEIALDVEWSHAMAPGANILLVEASSDSLTDLMDGVNYARHAAGVSVVSMSWGGSEFFSWNGGEFSSQTDYDPYFTTPAGHQGVTFIAAAGDSGAYGGVQWPASSPNVLSVGGTSLTVSDSSGTYYSESSWSGTSGGFSQVESEPSYQSNVQNTGVRTTPDVAYDGDPNTGFAVYDSLAYEGYSGWQEVGGTSAGAPQWAALVAIADQVRVLDGKGTLDGVSQTLPELYSLYADPSTSGYSTYETYFNDVVDYGGGGGRYHFRWGYGGNPNPATTGYDTATGLGSPHANMIVSALAGTTSSTGTGGNTNGSNGSNNGTANNSQQVASQLTLTILGSSPLTSVIGGQNGYLTLKITNTASTRFHGPVSITVYASSDGSITTDSLANDTAMTAVSFPNVLLHADGSRVVRVRFQYPTTLATGNYFLVASLEETAAVNTAPANTVTTSTVDVAAPVVDLSTIFLSTSPIALTAGKNASVVLTITNLGNVAAVGQILLNVYASTSANLDTNTATLLAGPTTRTIHLAARHTVRLRLTFKAPADQTPGSYYLIATNSSTTTPADTNATNDVAVIATTNA